MSVRVGVFKPSNSPRAIRLNHGKPQRCSILRYLNGFFACRAMNNSHAVSPTKERTPVRVSAKALLSDSLGQTLWNVLLSCHDGAV